MFKPPSTIISFLILLALLFAANPAAPVFADSIITVNTNADNTTDDGLCTLREAITNANADAQTYDDCETGTGADTITFAGNYTITLTSALPDITTNVTIDGNGAANTIVQASTCDPVTLPEGCTPSDWRVFTIDGAQVTLQDLTARYGNCDISATCSGTGTRNGGNIYANNSDLTLDAVHVQSGYSSSDGGGVFVEYSSLTIQNNSLIGGLGKGNKADIGNDSYAGGVFFRDGGTLLVDNSEVSYNIAGGYGGGIHAQNGTFIIQNGSLIDNNRTRNDSGGGVNAEGAGCQLTVDVSTISNNSMAYTSSAPRGGGLLTGCTTTINDSTFSGNTVEDGDGSGIYIFSTGNVTITNSTFADNQALGGSQKGGGIYNSGTLTVVNSTFYNNFAGESGGGIMNALGATATVINSTFANNDATDGGDSLNNFGTLHISNNIMAGGNVNNNCVNYGTILTDINNLIENNNLGLLQACGTPVSTADPNLGPLQDNGGAAQTMALLAPSPAINAGNDTVCADAATVNNLDQHGAPRPFGTHCDLGAYEFSAGSNFIVNTDADTNDGACDALGTGTGNQDCTLREALNAANADNTGAHEIAFAGDYTISLASGLPNLTGYLTISGVGRSVTVDGNDSYYIFNGLSGSIVTVDTLTLSHASVSLGNNNGTLTVLNSTIRDGYEDEETGGIYMYLGSLTVTNSTFYNNGGYTGAIIVNAGTATINNSTFYGNNGPSTGIIFTDDGVVTITNSIITNSAGDDCFIGAGGSGSFSGSNNLIDDHASGPCAGISNAAVTNLAASPADNGGPTHTIALLGGSNALDTGNNATCEAADQRGIARPQGSGCDIGAYEAQTFTLNVALAGSGAGSVSGPGIACESDCAEDYLETTVVTLTATPAEGSSFVGWSEACTNNTGDCVVTIDAAKSVTATFTKDEYRIFLPLLNR